MQHVPDQCASADIILVLQLIGVNDALLLLLLLVIGIRPAGMPPTRLGKMTLDLAMPHTCCWLMKHHSQPCNMAPHVRLVLV